MKIEREIDIKIKGGLKYAADGDMADAEFIKILKPTAKQIHLTSTLRQGFQRAAVALNEATNTGEEQEKDDDKETQLPTAQEALAILYASPENMDKIMISAKELMSSGLFLIDGEVKLTKPLIDKLDIEDFEELLGAFLVNFIISSLMG